MERGGIMRRPASMWSLENFGRVRLSKHFYMRDFLYSEIGNFHEIQNLPRDPDLVIENGRMLCTHLLDPLEETFGRLAIRSGYRSPELNKFGNENKLNCARNDNPIECHIWDLPHEPVAGPSIVIHRYADQYAEGRDWQDLAWWLYDHLPFAEAWFFPKLCAFNLAWRPDPQRRIDSYIAPKGTLHNRIGDAQAIEDFPTFRGLSLP